SGSGNLGTANAARAAGLLPALLVFCADSGKGALAMALAVRAFGRGPLALLALALIVLGHNFSVFVRFSGGKGLAAAAGALAVLSPSLLLATGTLGIAALAGTADFYLAAMAMAAGLPALVTLFFPGPGTLLAAGATSFTVLVRHRGNLGSLWPVTPNRGGRGDDRFLLAVGVACWLILTVWFAWRTPTACFQLPLFVIAGRWAGFGLLVLAAWAAISRDRRVALATAAAALLSFCLSAAVSLMAALGPVGSLALPPLYRQISGGSWPWGLASAAAVSVHHLYWVIGLAIAGTISRVLPERLR
ncbi:MAG: glycerol-3-phosphate acyltransferase, partial [Chloroflexota bacterium]